MSRRYRKSRRDPGLIEIAATSDWKVSAGMSAVCVLAGTVVIPALFGGSPILGPLVGLLTPLALVLAAVFAGIALIRSVKTPSDPVISVPNPAQKMRPPSATVVNPPLSDRDKAPLSSTLKNPDSVSTAARPDAWSREVIDRIEWKRFEDLCCEFYRVMGIRAETTSLGADGGVDIRLFQDDTQPHHCTAIVQCKAWGKAVGVKPVRELRGVMAHEKVEKAFFMAPNGFTEDAKSFATENRIILLDGSMFLSMLKRLPESQRQALLEFATAGDWTTPTCPSCGLKMTARDSRRGRFWGCPSYPGCRGTLPMRAATT